MLQGSRVRVSRVAVTGRLLPCPIGAGAKQVYTTTIVCSAARCRAAGHRIGVAAHARVSAWRMRTVLRRGGAPGGPAAAAGAAVAGGSALGRAAGGDKWPRDPPRGGGAGARPAPGGRRRAPG